MKKVSQRLKLLQENIILYFKRPTLSLDFAFSSVFTGSPVMESYLVKAQFSSQYPFEMVLEYASIVLCVMTN
jgi:hypothetical protein